MIHHPVQQNTDEPCPCCGKTWMELRAGKVTGSSIAVIMANFGKTFGDPAKRLAVDIATVELGGQPSKLEYSNFHMERGHEQEPLAIALYEREYLVEVEPGGFYDNGRTGCSPDGIEGNGIVEVKSVLNATHYECIDKNRADIKYKWQYRHNLKESGKEWIDCVSFCATFPEDKKLFVERLCAENLKDDFKLIDDRLAEFFELVDLIKAQIITYKG